MARKSVIAHIWRRPGDWQRGTETWGWLNHGDCYYGGGHLIMYLPKPMELHTHNDVEVYLKVKNSIVILENSRWNADCYISWPVLQMNCTSVGGGEHEEKWTSTTLIKGLWLKTQRTVHKHQTLVNVFPTGLKLSLLNIDDKMKMVQEDKSSRHCLNWVTGVMSPALTDIKSMFSLIRCIKKGPSSICYSFQTYITLI